MSDEEQAARRIAVFEILVVIGIPSALFGVLYPAVLAARQARRFDTAVVPLAPWQEWIVDQRWIPLVFPLVVVSIAGCMAFILSRVLPKAIRQHFQFWPQPAPQHPLPLRETAKPALWSIIVAPIGTLLLLTVFIHMRVARRQRVAVITWVGPLADYMPFFLAAGWLLSGLAVALGLYSAARCTHPLNWRGNVGMGLGTLNLFISFCICGAAHET